MPVPDVLLHYQTRIQELQVSLTDLRMSHASSTATLALAVGACLLLSFYAFRGQVSFLFPPLPVPVIAVSARRVQRDRDAKSRMWRLRRYYERAVERINGNWTESEFTGDDFAVPGHPYAGDLQVTGRGSLFQLLCIARTSIGRRGLADYLLAPPAIEETRVRQTAIRELTGREDLRDRVATLGEHDFFEAKWDTFEPWLESPAFVLGVPLRILLLTTSSLFAGIVLALFIGAGAWHVIFWETVAPLVYGLAAFHAIVGIHYRERVLRTLEAVQPVATETRVLREGLQVLETGAFECPKLCALAARVSGASAAMRKLERLLGALEQRNKDWFSGPSRALLVGTQLCAGIESWRREHGPALPGWLQAWAEYEALNCLGAHAFENPEHVFPEISTGPATFTASDLGHPLLPRETCVVNDIELQPGAPFYLISGSNMAGKSTLLRAIGLNAVLAMAGAPVRAKALCMTGLAVCGSLSVVDSLLGGKSRFMAEVERLRLALETAEGERPVLFLIDEIFSGTNSRDRRIASEAVVRTLVARGAIGALSTHDLALTEIATLDGLGGINVHMGSRNPADPMEFDYRLKLGVTQESNALAIARLAGVPV